MLKPLVYVLLIALDAAVLLAPLGLGLSPRPAGPAPVRIAQETGSPGKAP